MNDRAQVDGLDLDAVGGWLAREVPGLLGEPLTASLITGGKSNLTYRVTDGATEVVVRRPPLGHVLATAHDMGREYRVMKALADTAVPVPVVHAHCDDAAVTGAPFYVMASVPGTPYSRAAQLEEIGADRTRAIADRLVDTLVDLHAVDPASVGLADFGRPDGYLERQLRRWRKQLDSSRSRDIPGIDELATQLERQLPTHSEGTIVHGDYRLDNALVDSTPDGRDRITAVLDWEMSTLGDPLTDVALMLAYQQMAMSGGGAAVTDAPLAAGYPTRDEILQRYAATSGRDLGAMGFHIGLAFFKLAVILEGIHYRHSHGQTVGGGFDGLGDAVVVLVAAGLEATRV
ncbi:phosphotransferase family protein [Aeromicrobium sp.]|uniref:phosphotransferase family protein n=1 Tax=Aeromicrobium sp. TaxID=1871063 RepID=UPI0025C57F37|nr:phosphotransferase family protein [Aeromicrobium sp.]MCK5890192.1 phosphotransferase family protein [Aeromicrobium sp.]